MKGLVFLLAAFIIFTVTFLPSYLGPDDLEGCAQPSSAPACRGADAIVAVSGGDTRARTDEAIDLYEAGWANVLIFSGAAADMTGPSNAQAMKAQAVERGVVEQDIYIEELSRTTAENAANTGDLVRERGWSRLILVTSGYHQRRASLEFQTRLDENVEIVNHPVKFDNRWSQFWWLRPSEVFLAYSELVKIGAFYIKESV